MSDGLCEYYLIRHFDCNKTEPMMDNDTPCHHKQRFVLSRCVPKSSNKIIVSDKVAESKKRYFAEERKEYKKPCFVIPVLEIVPAFLN